MEVLSMILLIAASASLPQEVAPTHLQGAPGIVVLKWSWNEYSTARGNIPSSTATQPSRDPFGSKSKDPLETARRTETVNVRPSQRDNRPVKGYQYRVTVKNTGTKTIKSLRWDYIFIDSSNEDRVAHHQFRSDKKIRPGKKNEITEFSLVPPSRVVDVRVGNKTQGEPFVERVIITRIEYVDGSVWAAKI